MEFSTTEQQIPMVMRLLLLLNTLTNRDFKKESEAAIPEEVPEETGILSLFYLKAKGL